MSFIIYTKNNKDNSHGIQMPTKPKDLIVDCKQSKCVNEKKVEIKWFCGIKRKLFLHVYLQACGKCNQTKKTLE